jgi:hypothetical protein
VGEAKRRVSSYFLSPTVHFTINYPRSEKRGCMRGISGRGKGAGELILDIQGMALNSTRPYPVLLPNPSTDKSIILILLIKQK